MANVMINEQHLVDIANAIREKNGGTLQYKPRKMAQAILELDASGGGGTTLDLKFSELGYFTYRGVWDEFIQNNPTAIRFRNVSNADYAFANSNLTDVSAFPIIYRNGYESLYVNFEGMFDWATSMQYIFDISKDKAESFEPVYLSTIRYMCRYASQLRAIPESWGNDIFDYSSFQRADYAFQGCSSLRTIPPNFLKNLYSRTSTNRASQLYNYGFSGCMALDRLDKLPTDYGIEMNITQNMFYQTFYNNYRLNGITFHMPDKQPAICAWSNQIIDLASYNWVGFCPDYTDISVFGGSIPEGYEVYDDITYNELKNTGEWWTRNINYSRYNHDSAVETINSLPDTSVNGSGNSIIFTADSGAYTDGGAIGTLTEEEIAVATAKGWTVSYA